MIKVDESSICTSLLCSNDIVSHSHADSSSINERILSLKNHFENLLSLGKVLNANKRQIPFLKGEKKCLIVSDGDIDFYRAIVEKYSDQKDNIDFFCISQQALMFFGNAGLSVVGNLDLGTDFSSCDLHYLYSFIHQSCDTCVYNSIGMFVPDLCFGFVEYPLFSLDAFLSLAEQYGCSGQFESNEGEETIFDLIDSNQEMIHQFVMQVSEAMIYGVLLYAQQKSCSHSAHVREIFVPRLELSVFKKSFLSGQYISR